MMNAEEIPNWVPASVKKLAVRVSGFDDELVRRLVTDPKMENVWQYLLLRAQPMDFRSCRFQMDPGIIARIRDTHLGAGTDVRRFFSLRHK